MSLFHPDHNIFKYFSFLSLTKVQAYDEGLSRLLLVHCEGHVVLGTVIYVV